MIPVPSDLTVWRVLFKKQVTAWAEVKGELAGRLGESGRNEQSGRGPAKGKWMGLAHTAVTRGTVGRSVLGMGHSR